MFPRGVQKILTEVKELKTVLNVCIFCVLKKRCLQILTISLQVNFYQINFIQWFYEYRRSKDEINNNNSNKNQQFWFWYY